MIAEQQDAGLGPSVDSLNRFELIRRLRLCHDKIFKDTEGPKSTFRCPRILPLLDGFFGGTLG